MILLYNTRTPSKAKTVVDTMSLDCSSICYIGSRIGWVSALSYDITILFRDVHYWLKVMLSK